MKILFIIILLVNLIFASNISSQINLTTEEKSWLLNNPKISLGVIANQRPFSITKDNTNIGIVPDYIKLINKLIGQEIKIVSYPNSETLRKAIMNKNLYGTTTIIKDKIHSNKYLFTEPYMETPFNLFINKINEHKILNIKDLNGKTIAILKNHTKMLSYVKEIKGVNIVFVNSVKDQFELLQYQKVDAILGYLNYHYLLSKMLFNKVVFAFSSKENFDIRMGINLEHKILSQILDKAILQLSENEKQQIVQKWLKPTKSKSNEYLTYNEKKWLEKKSYSKS